jgi:anaerobic magnesium-protoporphyrin IX monomethyl ester cyclase
MTRILLINPAMMDVYKIAKIKMSVPYHLPLNLLTIATPLLERGYEVQLLDLNYHTDLEEALINALNEFAPDYAGITFTTPLYSQSLRIISQVKDYSNDIITIAGGVHITSDCMGTMKDSRIDIAVLGEGDFKLLEIIESDDIKVIKGIAYRSNGEISINERDPGIKDLDRIPFPAISLIDINQYKLPHTIRKLDPVCPLETSRGCVYSCTYCNKSIFGKTFRVKSPERVIDDLKRIASLGFKEAHIVDDGFSTNINRAKEICRLVIKENIDLLINCANGIRVDRIDYELLELMKKAGIYRVSLGIESGSQRILNNVDKGIKLEDYEKAFKMFRKVGIETLAYFMFGLPDEQESDMKKTIKFAKKLRPDVAKFSITIPLPSTPLYEDWKAKGYILTNNWDDYGFYTEKKIYEHPNLSLDTLTKYLDQSYRAFYFSPGYIIRKFFSSLKEGTLIEDFKMFVRIKW